MYKATQTWIVEDLNEGSVQVRAEAGLAICKVSWIKDDGMIETQDLALPTRLAVEMAEVLPDLIAAAEGA